MVAFAPLLAIEGIFSTVAKQIPLIVIPVLAFSLVESKLILPSHMSTIKPATMMTWAGSADSNTILQEF